MDERVDSIDKIELFPDSIEALKYLADNGFAAVFITNQAGIAEAKLTEAEFWTIHEEVLSRLAPSGMKFLKTCMNAEAGQHASEWHKPGPKMLLQAADELSLDVRELYMVGDNQSDILAGRNAGCKGSILVKTARNRMVESTDAVYSAENLLDAARYIVANS